MARASDHEPLRIDVLWGRKRSRGDRNYTGSVVVWTDKSTRAELRTLIRHDADSLTSNATMAATSGDYWQALRHYNILERLEPENAHWSWCAGDMYRRIGSRTDALAAFSRADTKFSHVGMPEQASAVRALIAELGGSDRRLAVGTQRDVPIQPAATPAPQSTPTLSEDSARWLLQLVN